MRKLANHVCTQIVQVDRQILARHLYSKHRYMQRFEGNWEQENWLISGKWVGKSLSDNSTLSTTCKHQKVPGEEGNWPTTCADMSGRWLRKSWYDKHMNMQTSKGN
ncbi:unnamed protein product [Prunus armeniaca]